MKFMYGRVIENDHSGNLRILNIYDYGENIIIMKREDVQDQGVYECINKDGETQTLGSGDFELILESEMRGGDCNEQ